MSGYRKLLASAAIATLPSAAIDPVFAQIEADTIDGDSATETRLATLPTVVVTAQKRSEDIQDVPIVITAFSEDQIAAFGASTLEKLPNYIAGVELLDERGAGQPTWIIRGVGLVDFNANNAPTASIFDDEVYLGSNVLGGLGLFDLERVEVLKGAQGGLYGRNTTGGAVRYIPHTPRVGAPLSGNVQASYGRWGRTSLKAALAGPIGDRAAFRVSAMGDFGGGWQDSLVTPDDDQYGNSDFIAFRAQIAADLTDKLSVRLKASAGRDKSETALLRALAPFDALTGGPCAPALAGNPDPETCITHYNSTSFVASGGTDIGLLANAQDQRGERVLSQPINQVDNDWAGINLYATYDFDGFDVTSITSYQDYNAGQIFDFDSSPAILFHEDTSSLFDVFSQEVRISSTTAGPADWQIGANYSQTDLDESRLGDLSENILVLPVQSRRSFEQEVRHFAVYGEGSYDLSEQLSLNASLRYTDEEKSLKNFTNVIESDPFQLLVETPGDLFLGPVNFDYDLDANVSGHLGLNYKITPDALAYAKATRSFKSGGFFGGFALSADELAPYEEETVWAYEAGAKIDFPDHGLRVNGAVFYYDYQDVQSFTTIVDPTLGVLTQLGNLGTAEHIGADLDVLWQPPEIEGLTLQASASWLDAEIVESDVLETSVLIDFVSGGPDDPPVVAGIEGQPRSFAPEFSYTLVGAYEKNVSADLTAKATLNWSWRSDFFRGDQFAFDDGLAAHDGYGLLGGRLELSSKAGWSIALLGQNLTNETYIQRATSDDLLSFGQVPGRPMSWSLAIGFEF